jgi:small subunit ribosomal protein S1
VSESPPSISIADLEPKMRLEGTVSKVELFGAFVDIGLGHEGLVHISQLKSSGHINNVSDVLKEGQSITVWVKDVDPDTGRIDLTMIEPLAVEWDELQVGQVYRGKVVRIEKFGVFVDIGAERSGLVHISELSAGYVRSPQDVVNRGDEVEVKVIGFSRKKGRIDLSMKVLADDGPVSEEEEQLPTAMSLAWQRALAEKDKAETSSPGRRPDQLRDSRREQDEILERTLQQHKGRKS